MDEVDLVRIVPVITGTLVLRLLCLLGKRIVLDEVDGLVQRHESSVDIAFQIKINSKLCPSFLLPA